MTQLVVAEKPSVARDIARVLGVGSRGEGCLRGAGVWITWCVGHVAELVEPEAYNPAWKKWSPHTLPMLPEAFTLRPSRHAYDQWKHVKALLRHPEVTEVVNACDAGREGELIFRFAYELAGCRKPVRRLWLSALTDGAVRAGFRSLKPASAFDALAAAARSRAEADWLVGLNATRALTLRQRAQPTTSATRSQDGKPPLFSVGRVQTPTLAMLVAREREIAAFVPKKFWQVLATFAANAGTYEGTYQRPQQPDTAAQRARPAAPLLADAPSAPMRSAATSRHGGEGTDGAWADRLERRQDAEAIAAAVHGQRGKVEAVDRREHNELPPRLFDLTDLQRRANVRYHMSASQTLEAAQSLYEKHKLLTYPRTDSNCLTQDMAQTLPGVLRGLDTAPYSEHVQPLLALDRLPLSSRIINDAEVGDHHAIIPTGKRPTLAALGPAERQVFDLVARRFIAAFHPPARFALTRIDTRVGEHLFVSRGRVCLAPGWQTVEPPLGSQRLGQGEPPLLPRVSRDDATQVQDAKLRDGETKPPPRYNDALLLSAMERAGAECGTAELRLAMKDGGLGTPATRASIIEMLQRRGYARRDGKVLVPTSQGDALIRALPVADLKSPELTGAWEARLARVAKGELSRATFMAEVSTLTKDVVTAILGDYTTWPKPIPAERMARPSKPRKAKARGKGAATTTAAAPKASRKRCAPAAGSPKVSLNAAAAAHARSSPPPVINGAPSPKPERPRRVVAMPTCPLCKKVPLMRGRAAWGCSAWREGCTFTLAFAPMGHPLSDSAMQRLIAKGATAGFDSIGAGGHVKFQLDLQAQGRVRLVPARQRKARTPASPGSTSDL